MRRAEYFNFLQETSELVWPTIKNYVEPFRDINKELYDILMVFVESRLGSRLQKPALFRLAYELCGGKDWEKVIPAAVAFEFINISSYQANSAFDDKLGILTKPQKDSQFIASMISRELSFKAAAEIEKYFSEQFVTKLYSSLSMSNYYIYIAQHYDLNIVRTDKIENYNEERVFFRDYFNRCFYGSGIINGQCAYIGGLLGGGKPEELDSLRNFGESFGTGLQIINDLGDFVPADFDPLIGRAFQDQYSDFRNARLTLPLYYLLRFGNSQAKAKVRDIMDKRQFDIDSLFEVTLLLVGEGAVDYTKSTARGFAEKAKEQLSIFKENVSKHLLLIMATIIPINKYLFALNRIANECCRTESFASTEEC